MDELVSMVVPLHTLPGWPVAPTVSPLHAIGLLIVLPAIVIVIISTIGQVGHKVAQSRPRPSWQEHAVGGGTGPGSLGGSGTGAALPAGRSATAGDPLQNPTEESGSLETEPQAARRPGGASARW